MKLGYELFRCDITIVKSKNGKTICSMDTLTSISYEHIKCGHKKFLQF